MTATQTSPASSPAALWAALVAAVIGAGLSLYLTWVHLIVQAGDTVGGLCNLSSKVNCNIAAGSIYSEVAGIPVAVIGFGFYAATVAVLWAGRRNTELAGRLLVTLYGAACLYSLFLAAVSAFVLGSFCWACTSLYVVNVGLLVLGRFLSGEPYLRAMRRLVAERTVLARSPLPAAFVITFIGAMAAAHFGAAEVHRAVAPSPEQLRSEAQIWVRDAFARERPVAPALWERMTQGPSKGPAEACVTVVEFSDFQCPFCSKVVPAVDKLLVTWPQDVRVVFRNNPLDHHCNPRLDKPFHPYACGAARAAVCAQEQGAFWKMHDTLFANQTRLREPDLLGYATALGLGRDELAQCMNSDRPGATLKADLALAAEVGIRGTPALFMNGRKIPGGAVGYERLAAAVESELKTCAGARN